MDQAVMKDFISEDKFQPEQSYQATISEYNKFKESWK